MGFPSGWLMGGRPLSPPHGQRQARRNHRQSNDLQELPDAFVDAADLGEVLAGPLQLPHDGGRGRGTAMRACTGWTPLSYGAS